MIMILNFFDPEAFMGICPPIKSVACLLLCLATSQVALANDRRFTYSYESGVLPPGERELEVWSTARLGRESRYTRFDERLEFEVGLTQRLMTALYLNGTSVTQPDGTGGLSTAFEFKGISSEWKYKLLDPVADPVGLALYGEVTGSGDEVELEAKVIVDKRVGNFLFALNLVGEQEWEFELEEVLAESILEPAVGVAYFVTPSFSVGLEARNHNELVSGKLEHSALFAGPVVGFAREGWWVAFSVLPQLPALKSHDPKEPRDLHEHEKINARLLFSFHL